MESELIYPADNVDRWQIKLGDTDLALCRVDIVDEVMGLYRISSFELSDWDEIRAAAVKVGYLNVIRSYFNNRRARRFEHFIRCDRVEMREDLEDLGFEHEGTLRKLLIHEGKVYDVELLSILGDEIHNATAKAVAELQELAGANNGSD